MKTRDKIEPQVLPPDLLRRVPEERKRIESLQEWKRFHSSSNSLIKAAFKGSIPFDPRFNSVHWAFDVNLLCRAIAYSIWWMNAYAGYYKQQVKVGSAPSHVDLNVSYFADNCVTTIHSCRDKMALMIWALYVPFNPEKRKEVIDYEQVAERLRCPMKFGLRINNHRGFLKCLESLKGPDFDCLAKYRHLKIHRREPRIEIYGVQSHHDWPYLVPLSDKKDIADWRASLAKQYPHADSRELQSLEQGSHIKGVLFDQRKLKDRLWEFAAVKKHIESCLIKLLAASATCFDTLRKRKPLRSAR